MTWKCRTVAFKYPLDQRVRFMFTSNARAKWKHDPPILEGFYRCALMFMVTEITDA